MFDRRHVEFLAKFAGRNLSHEDTDKLVAAIREVMPSFRADLFTAAADRVRPRRKRGDTVEDRVNAKMTALAESLADHARPRA